MSSYGLNFFLEGVVAESWISYLKESHFATWETGVIGDAQLVQMESRARLKEKKNEEIFKKLNENAKAAAVAANAKIMLMEKKVEEDRKLKFKLRQLKKERAKIEQKVNARLIRPDSSA